MFTIEPDSNEKYFAMCLHIAVHANVIGYEISIGEIMNIAELCLIYKQDYEYIMHTRIRRMYNKPMTGNALPVCNELCRIFINKHYASLDDRQY